MIYHNWNVSNVVNMTEIFFGSKFNQNISSWDIRNALYKDNMFKKN